MGFPLSAPVWLILSNTGIASKFSVSSLGCAKRAFLTGADAGFTDGVVCCCTFFTETGTTWVRFCFLRILGRVSSCSC